MSVEKIVLYKVYYNSSGTEHYSIYNPRTRRYISGGVDNNVNERRIYNNGGAILNPNGISKAEQSIIKALKLNKKKPKLSRFKSIMNK